MNTRTQGFHMLSPKAQQIYKRYGGNVTGDSAPSHLPTAVGDDAEPAAAGLPAGWTVQVH
jgi:hypothetical protein